MNEKHKIPSTLGVAQTAFEEDPSDDNADAYQTSALVYWYDDKITTNTLLKILRQIKDR